jgi:hypothetical protein
MEGCPAPGQASLAVSVSLGSYGSYEISGELILGSPEVISFPQELFRQRRGRLKAELLRDSQKISESIVFLVRPGLSRLPDFRPVPVT